MSFVPWIALFLPLVSFIVQLVAYPILTRRQTAWIACSSLVISFLLFVMILLSYLQNDMIALDLSLFKWIPIESINANFGIHIDALSLVMALIITGIGSLIHIYSVGYMDHEEDYVRYFACLNLFIFAMLILVLADNLLLLFVGWEGVGLASYLLIGYDYYRPKAAAAAVKAFVVNRIGDFGLLLGLLLTFRTFGTSNMMDINQQLNGFNLGDPIITAIALLYFFGACGKSAQIPLHVWLADAMEGPTPVSALIHAATMVTAGVYLVVRMDALFILSPLALQVIGTVGAATALFAALCAIGQTDLKRVLAYSTVSQLGYMFMACGAKAFYAAMFHLTMHALIKALLFLSAGNVVYVLHGLTDMRKMGGLAKKLPITNYFFLFGVLALSGVPPFAAFFSKELILGQEHLAGFDALFYMGLFTSILTAFYLTRAYCLTFTGTSRLPTALENSADPIHDAPKIMLIPTSVLLFFSLIGGALGFSASGIPPLLSFLKEIGITPTEYELSTHFAFTAELNMAVIGAFLGIGLAILLYAFYPKQENPIRLFKRAFYIDEIYNMFIVQPLKKLSYAISSRVEPEIFTGSMQQITKATSSLAGFFQEMQSGQIRSYVAWMAATAAFLVTYILAS